MNKREREWRNWMELEILRYAVMVGVGWEGENDEDRFSLIT